MLGQTNFNPSLMHYTKFNSKCIIDSHVKPKTMKCPEETIREKFCGLVLGKDFLDMTTKGQFITGKTVKLDFIKMKNFNTLKDC